MTLFRSNSLSQRGLMLLLHLKSLSIQFSWIMWIKEKVLSIPTIFWIQKSREREWKKEKKISVEKVVMGMSSSSESQILCHQDSHSHPSGVSWTHLLLWRHTNIIDLRWLKIAHIQSHEKWSRGHPFST